MLRAERAPDSPRDHVPPGTTPTWEMELLLSGATVFGLMQVPAWIDPFFFRHFQAVDDGLASNLVAVWMYARGSIMILTVTFVVHLALRAFWVALAGMSSVYPGGLDWGRLRAGPIQRAAMEGAVSDVPARIEAADNRATRVFALGVAIATVLLVPFVFVSIGIGAAVALRALGGPDLTRWGLVGGVGLVMGPFAVAALLDRRLGSRAAPGGRVARALGSVFRRYDRVGLGAASNPILALFQSHEGLVRTMGITIAAMLAVFGIVMVQFAQTLGDDTPWGDYAGLPASDAGARETLLPGHYATQRRADQVLALPYVQDRVVRGPYVELFVPYRPARHAPAMRALCGEAVAVVEGGGPPAEALACLARVLDVRLDGAAVEAPLQGTSDPLTGIPGVLAMIPAADLAPGRHELTIRRLARQGTEKIPEPFRIPFWR